MPKLALWHIHKNARRNLSGGFPPPNRVNFVIYFIIPVCLFSSDFGRQIFCYFPDKPNKKRSGAELSPFNRFVTVTVFSAACCLFGY